MSLAGLFGCDVEATAPAEAPTPRIYGEPMPPGFDCLKETTVILKHDDGTVDSHASITTGLAKYTRPNDVVEVYLARTAECVAERGPMVSLATYTTAGLGLGVSNSPPAHAYDMDTAAIGEGGGKLVVRVPDCGFQLQLVHGDALRTLQSPGQQHAFLDRIAAIKGGEGACEAAPKLELAAFDTVERGWGDAPLLTHFGWSAQSDGPLTCAFDLDGDGALELTRSPCEPSTASVEVSKLPAHTYLAPGEHRPRMRVSNGERRLWASTSVHANKLQLKSSVRYPEKTPLFVKSELIPGKDGQVAQVVVHYTSTAGIPYVKPGAVILGKGAQPYMLRVTGVSLDPDRATYTGYPATLKDVVAGGYYGVRDFQVPTDGVKCVGECIGELEPIAAPPGQAAAPVPLAKSVQALDVAEDEPEFKYGVKITVPLGEFGGAEEGGGTEETVSEAELFGGIVIEKFVIDNLVFGDLIVDIKAAPTIEASVALVKAFSFTKGLGRWKLAALPFPIPITLDMLPELTIESSYKFAGKVTAKAPMRIVNGVSGIEHEVDGEVSGEAVSLETSPATELALEGKVTFTDKLQFVLGFLDGPHLAPFGTLGLKATASECKFCVTVFSEIGALMGWDTSWGWGSLLDPMKVTLLEIELAKKCDPIVGFCEPPEPPAPGGGTHGDVHVITHDGLLFDFQAGGEFVLVRATAGASLEIQARQEPLGGLTSLSYNTAVATVVGGARVGIYTQLPSAVYVDGVATSLEPNSQIAVGAGGVLARDAGSRYTLTYPGGEVLRVRHGGNHLDLDVALPVARAGAVEGVLGNSNGVLADDIGVGDGYLPQPVSFDALYHGPDSFAEAWRVAPEASLFDYAAGTSAATFNAPPYTLMPTGLPPADPEHMDVALAACAACPPALLDGCLLDVGFTNDPSFASACDEVTAEVAEVMVPADGFVCVSPRYFAEIDMNDQQLVFRGPGLAGADQFPAGLDLEVRITGKFNIEPGVESGFSIISFDTTTPPAGGAPDWGTKFECGPIGDSGWGECVLRFDLTQGPYSGVHFPIYKWSVWTKDDALIDTAYFTRP